MDTTLVGQPPRAAEAVRVPSPGTAGERLLSLDLFRGVTMFLLVAEGTRLYGVLEDLFPPDTALGKVVEQFQHHIWNGLHFWDLIQPFFMFIVGVAMVYSLTKRWQRGESWAQSFRHILIRCLTLFTLGVVIHCAGAGRLVWELWNVLTQLSFTILVAFLIFRLPLATQLFISLGLLLLRELLFRFILLPGYDQPFVQDRNFGSYIDMILMGKLNDGGGWVTINCIPTAAHTIWGVLAGKILQSDRAAMKKVAIIGGAGILGLLIGYPMDWVGFDPIIKRICTASFIFASGGWALVALAFSYWLVDVKGARKGILFFSIVGMNSIFIYMFSETVGYRWFNGFVAIFTDGILGGWMGLNSGLVAVAGPLAALAIEWYLCYWLYTKRILIRI